MVQELQNIVNTVRGNKGLDPVAAIGDETRLREDLGMDSLDLAELTVRIESVFQVDVFEDGVVNTVEEILAKIGEKK